jgi:GH15 family glucan-1,4-alpha-glucosidase
VEQGRSLLILLTQAENGRITEEQVDVPASHAEALMNVAAGMIAFDRTPRQVGNFPQAFSHLALINSIHNLYRITKPVDQRASSATSMT